MPQQPYRFHAYEISYFSGKVRPALRHKRLFYEEVRADTREILRRTGLAFIPILITPSGETWQDTSDILDALERAHPEPALYPASPVQRVVSYLLELYADEFAVLPAMHYRWSWPDGAREAKDRFGAATGTPEASAKFADRMKGALPFLGVSEATAPAIEAHTCELLDALGAHFAAHPFLLGDRLSLGDCALMGPLYAHLFNDRLPRRLLTDTALPVVGWIERCNYPSPEPPGAWLANDALAPTLVELLRIMARDAVPVLLDGARAIEGWADTRAADAEPPPRFVGTHETSLRGAKMTRATQVYGLWMLQRPLDAHQALPPADRAAVDRALAGTGWEELLAYRPRHRLGKRNFQLVFEGRAD